jgi:sialic acid synthase SpsE
MRPPPNSGLTSGRWVGVDHPCYVVAEVGQNHNGRMAVARRLIDGVAASGADAVKFCKRHLPSELTRDAARRPYTGRQSFGPTYGEHRRALELSPAQHAELKAYVESGRGAGDWGLGKNQLANGHLPSPQPPVHSPAARLTYFATACDPQSVDDLEAIGVPFHKIASRDLTNLPLLDYVARTGKPIILSCGMDSLDEISQALDTVRMHHDQIVLLHCTSAYPTPYQDVNLRAMETLRREFDVLVGLSDHSVGTAVPLAAAALGAVMIEKHVTLGRRMKGTDHACSLELPELCEMLRGIRAIEQALGDGVKRVPDCVRATKTKLGRSVVSRWKIPRGTRLTEEMLCLKCAGGGLTWFDRKRIVGRVARRDIDVDETLTAADVE